MNTIRLKWYHTNLKTGKSETFDAFRLLHVIQENKITLRGYFELYLKFCFEFSKTLKKLSLSRSKNYILIDIILRIRVCHNTMIMLEVEEATTAIQIRTALQNGT